MRMFLRSLDLSSILTWPLKVMWRSFQGHNQFIPMTVLIWHYKQLYTLFSSLNPNPRFVYSLHSRFKVIWRSNWGSSTKKSEKNSWSCFWVHWIWVRGRVNHTRLSEGHFKVISTIWPQNCLQMTLYGQTDLRFGFSDLKNLHRNFFRFFYVFPQFNL